MGRGEDAPRCLWAAAGSTAPLLSRRFAFLLPELALDLLCMHIFKVVFHTIFKTYFLVVVVLSLLSRPIQMGTTVLLMSFPIGPPFLLSWVASDSTQS